MDYKGHAGFAEKVRAIGMENRRTLQMGASACVWDGSKRELDLRSLQSSVRVCVNVCLYAYMLVCLYVGTYECVRGM